MAETPSTMLPIGTPMPDFTLPDFSGTTFSSSSLTGRPALIVFMCNHCPFVKHVIDVLADKARTYESQGVAVVAINANDVRTHPQDSPENMKVFAAERGFDFPYLYDETQEVARAFQAACTPDFFLFDTAGHLVYRGQFDDSRPSSEIPVSGADLSAAVDAVAAGRRVSEDQKPSVGCNIKWRPGNEPGLRTL